MDEWRLLQEYVEENSQAAFARLVEHYINLVYSTCLREVRDPALAEDVTQVVFLVLSQKAKKLRRGKPLSAWLYQTARFASRDALKQEARRHTYEHLAAEEMMREMIQDMAPDKEAGWQQLEPLLHEALDSLSAGERSVLLLRFFEGRSLRETGDALAISEEAARKRIERALEKMRRHFSSHGFEVSGVVLATLLSSNASQAAPSTCVTATLHVTATLQATTATALHTMTAELVGAKVYSLWQGTMHALFVHKALVTAGLVVGLGMGGVGAGKVVQLALANTQHEPTRFVQQQAVQQQAVQQQAVQQPATQGSRSEIAPTEKNSLSQAPLLPAPVAPSPAERPLKHAEPKRRRTPKLPASKVSQSRVGETTELKRSLPVAPRVDRPPTGTPPIKQQPAIASPAFAARPIAARPSAAPPTTAAPMVALPPVVPMTVALDNYPLEQTVDGVTMRVTDAVFRSGLLEVDGQVVAARPDLVEPARLPTLRPQASFISPQGVVVQADQVDPRWPYVSVQYELLLPGAPLRAMRSFREHIEFKDLPVPNRINEELPLNRVAETARGTKILLSSVAAMTQEDAAGGVTGHLRYTIRHEAPPGSLVMQTLVGLAAAEEVAGGWKSGLLSTSVGGGIHQQMPLVPGTVKALNLKVAVQEDAPGLRDPRWHRTFRFKLQLPPLTTAVIAANKRPESAPVQVQSKVQSNRLVHAVLDDLLPEPPTSPRWLTHIWLQDRSPSSDPNRFWYVQSATARDADTGRPLRRENVDPKRIMGFVWDSPWANNRYWKSNGDMLRPRERSDLLMWRAEDGRRPAAVDLETTLIAARRFFHLIPLTGLPIPPTAGEIAVNREYRSRDGALLTLTKIRHVVRPDNIQEGPRTTAQAAWDHGRAGVLELTLKYSPVSAKPDQLRLQVMGARDNAGRDIKTYDTSGMYPDPRQQEATWRISVQDLPAETTAFDVQVQVSEFATTGESTTLFFPKVPVSAPASMPILAEGR